MRRAGCVWWLAVLVGVAAPYTRSSTTHAQDPANPKPVEEDRSAFQEQAQRFYHRVVADEARPDERRYSAEDLLALATPEARKLVADLLADASHPAAQVAVCAALIGEGRSHESWLAPAYVSPLIDLLASDRDDVRGHAAKVLAAYPSGDVSHRLAAIVSAPESTGRQRSAAIDALAINVHRFEVASCLVALLDGDDQQVQQRVLAALEQASQSSFGGDVELARAWWAKRSTRMDWLSDQVEVQSARYYEVERTLSQCQADASKRERQLVDRLKTLQREFFHSLETDQPNLTPRQRRQAKLVAWLNDPLAEVTQTALAIIRAQLADDGRQPTGDVLTALLRLLGHDVVEMRLEVLLIVENVADPIVVDAVLTRLGEETDVRVRRAIFKALGRLSDVRAMPVLTAELANHQSPATCVREAALALGRIAALPGAREQLGNAVEHLTSRYQASSTADKSLRAALLEAMATVADPGFRDAFVDALQTDDVEGLRPAIRGLLELGDVSQLARLRSLTAFADPMVRVSAIRAIGQLAKEEADLEAVMARLNPAVETSDLARDAAWNAFVAVLGHRSVAERIERAGRLRETPDLYIRYLQRLIEELPVGNGNTQHAVTVHNLLVDAFLAAGRFADAAIHLREVCRLEAAKDAGSATACRLRLLDALLHAGVMDEAATLIGTIAARPVDETTCDKLVGVLDAYRSSLTGEEMQDAREALAEMLGQIDAAACAPQWSKIIGGDGQGNASPPKTDDTPATPPPSELEPEVDARPVE